MPDLPKLKVGIVACSGEDLPEGTITRLAALRVLEQLRPGDTVTICLPLFMAGGEGDRAFARYYPTIAIDGCAHRCAARATERLSGRPAAEVVVREVIAMRGIGCVKGRRRLNQAGVAAVEATAEQVVGLVDQLMGRSGGAPAEPQAPTEPASCACGSGIPVQTLTIAGRRVTMIALPLIFAQLHEEGRPADTAAARELLEAVQIYNLVPPEATDTYAAALREAYAKFCAQTEVPV